MADWLVRQSGNPPIGPVSTELVIRGIEAGKVALSAEVCRVGTREWMPIDMVDEFSHVTYDEDAATRVTESPWFMDTHSSQRRIAPPPAPSRPRPASALGLAAPPPPPARSGPRAAPQPMHVAAPPPPAALPLPPRAPADRAYDVDENAQTRVANSSDDALGESSFEIDDETMTRVAAPRTGPTEPIGAVPRNRGLLNTAPMWPPGTGPVGSVRPAAGSPARVITPRPAAGARPESAIEVRPDLVPSPARFPAAPPGFPTAPAAPHYTPPSLGPTLPSAAPPPPQYGSASRPYPQQPQRPQPGAEHRGDGGVKALIALIILLFMALMVVLILLVLRR